jgi:hypothetical protein
MGLMSGTLGDGQNREKHSIFIGVLTDFRCGKKPGCH